MNYMINITKDGFTSHKHRVYEIIVYIDGEGIFYTEDKNFFVSKGNIAIIPPDTFHHSSLENCLERIYINGEFNQIFNLTSPAIISDNSKKEGTALAKMIYDNRYQHPDYVAALCSAFAHFLLQNIKMEDSIGMVVNEIINEITENFHDCNINLANILKKSGYAEDYIRAQFKKITGKTPTEFLTDARIHHACYLMDIYKNSLPLSQIAEKCGYDDYIYFSRRFKQVIGVSPRTYKKNE